MTANQSDSRPSPLARPQRAKSVIALRRITQREVARSTRASEFYVSRVFNGMTPPTQQFARALADYLGVSERQLFRQQRAPISPRTQGLRRGEPRAADVQR